MNNISLSTALASILAAGAVWSPDTHAVLVDDFSTVQSTSVELVGNTPPAGAQSDSSSVVGGGAVGGERDLSITVTAGTDGDRMRLRANPAGDDLLRLSQDESINGDWQVVWDGLDGDADNINFTGLGGVDLTEGGAHNSLLLTIVVADLAADLEFTLYTDQNNFATGMLNLPGGISVSNGNTHQDYWIDYSTFNITGGGFDFANIGAVALNGSSVNDGVDMRIERLLTAPSGIDPIDMPAPAALGLMLLGLCGLRRARR